MTKKKTVILKIGTSTLTKGSGQISRGKIEDLARQIIALKDQFQFIIVSSGAIATAKQYIGLNGGSEIAVKQALAAIGQPALMKIYQEGFQDFGLKTAQCLLHYRDFEEESAQINIINTIDLLLQNDFIPIINENDTVSTHEIKIGDNDQLSALVAALIKADILVLASDINGLYDKDPNLFPDANIITEVTDIESIKHLAGKSASSQGTGGMKTKVIAAEICVNAGVEMWIVNGNEESFFLKAFENQVVFTKFLDKV